MRLYHNSKILLNLKSMNIKVLIYSLVLGFSTLNASAQSSAVEKADKKYARYAYIDAIKTYEVVAEKGYKSVDMFQKLGNAFYFNAQLEKAAKWYAALFAMTTDFEPEYYYRYAQSLKSIGEYKKADEMMTTFNLKSDTIQEEHFTMPRKIIWKKSRPIPEDTKLKMPESIQNIPITEVHFLPKN